MAQGKVTFDIIANSDKFKKGIEAANVNVNRLVAGLGLIAGGVTILNKVGGAALGMSVSFEKGMAMVSTLINDSSVDIDALGKDVRGLAAQYGYTADEGAAAFYQLLSAGVPLEDAMSAFESGMKGAVASGADLTTTIDTMTSVMNSYGLEGKDTDKVLNHLINTQNLGKTTLQELGGAIGRVAPAAAAMNIGFDEVSATMATITATGVSTSEAVTQLSGLMREMNKETSDVSMAFEELTGTSIRQFLAEGGTMQEVLKMLSAEQEANGKSLRDLFSDQSSMSAATALSNGNFETYDATLNSVRSSTDTLDKSFDKMNDTSAQSSKVIKEGFNNALIDLGDIIKNATGPAMEFFADKIDILAPILIGFAIVLGVLLTVMGVYMVVTAMSTAVTTAFTAVLSVLTSPITAIVVAVIAIIAVIVIFKDKIVNFLQPAIDKIKEAFIALKDKIMEIAGNIKEALQPVVDFVKDVLIMAFENFKENMSAVGDGIKTTFSKINEALQPVKDQLGELKDKFDTFKGAVEATASAIAEKLQPHLDTLKSIIDSVKGQLLDLKDKLTAAFGPALEAAKANITALKEKLEPVREKLQEFSDFLKDKLEPALKIIGIAIGIIVAAFLIAILIVPILIIALLLLVNFIIEFVKTIPEKFEELKEAVKQKISDMWEAIKQKFSDAIESIKQGVTDFKDRVTEAFENLKSGIQGKIDSIVGKLQAFKDKVTGVKDAIVGAFKNITEGISMGISGGVDSLISKVKSNVNTYMVSPLNSAIGVINKIPNVNIPNVPSLSIGTDYVNQDGLAMLHKGEMVVPADVVGGGFTRDGRGGNDSTNVVNNITIKDSGNPQATAKVVVKEISKMLKNKTNYRGV